MKDVEKFEIAQGIPEILSADKVKDLLAFLETTGEVRASLLNPDG